MLLNMVIHELDHHRLFFFFAIEAVKHFEALMTDPHLVHSTTFALIEVTSELHLVQLLY